MWSIAGGIYVWFKNIVYGQVLMFDVTFCVFLLTLLLLECGLLEEGSICVWCYVVFPHHSSVWGEGVPVGTPVMKPTQQTDKYM